TLTIAHHRTSTVALLQQAPQQSGFRLRRRLTGCKGPISEGSEIIVHERLARDREQRRVGVECIALGSLAPRRVLNLASFRNLLQRAKLTQPKRRARAEVRPRALARK